MSRSFEYVIADELDFCAVCGRPILPGDYAMRERGGKGEMRHQGYDETPPCGYVFNIGSDAGRPNK